MRPSTFKLFDIERTANSHFPVFDTPLFTVSVQGSTSHYCSPREDYLRLNRYTSMEVLIRDKATIDPRTHPLLKHFEWASHFTDALTASYVPIETARHIIEDLRDTKKSSQVWHIVTMDEYVRAEITLSNARWYAISTACDSRKRPSFKRLGPQCYYYHGPARPERNTEYYIGTVKGLAAQGFDIEDYIARSKPGSSTS